MYSAPAYKRTGCFARHPRLYIYGRCRWLALVKTHDSESRGQEEAQQRDHCRELFTRSTALKLANALAKPPLKLSLSYYRPTTFLLYRINKPRMEDIGATIPKYQPLRDLWRPLCDYARRTILSRPIRPFTRQLVPSLFEESISRS